MTERPLRVTSELRAQVRVPDRTRREHDVPSMNGDVVRSKALDGTGDRAEILDDGFHALAIDSRYRSRLSEASLAQNRMHSAGPVSALSGFCDVQFAPSGAEPEAARLAQTLGDDLDIRPTGLDLTPRRCKRRRDHECECGDTCQAGPKCATEPHGNPPLSVWIKESMSPERESSRSERFGVIR